MIQISNIKLKVPHTEEALKEKALKQLHIRPQELLSMQIMKRSLDARRKPELYYVYTILLSVKNESRLKKKKLSGNVKFCDPPVPYKIVPTGTENMVHPPVVVGSGPAGLFCAYSLAKMGYDPILIERGEDVDTRMQDVNGFWNGKALLPNSNVQFGEGGAGTFSDGKLNTLVHDKEGRGRAVLETFVKFGAPEKILYDNKPHVGTDILSVVVKRMRQEIIRMGGSVHFHTQMTELMTDKNKLTGIKTVDTHTKEETCIPCEALVLAIGHSARDTFEMLKEKNVPMNAKSFAVGVRVEHPQAMINENQYGIANPKGLSAAPYKLTANLENGRGVYTFCMCPGGYVVNASSEAGRLAVNGMSYSGRDGVNANSAVIVTVTPEDYGSDDVLAGMQFQRKLEQAAYEAGKGNIPVQLFKDFCNNTPSVSGGKIKPQMKGAFEWANIRPIFPEEIAASLEEGIKSFDSKIKGYADDETLLSGVESRTSSPVRILRDETLQSSLKGLYPCGEGAGYAGGITSAAMDGLKSAEAISAYYRPAGMR
ncbi:MAG: FAD-dependent oxidoreductase [Lachnospiraceae bacterium]|nr:FAD-dependent oxidoreductase [Lachnospiraceae bacterium]